MSLVSIEHFKITESSKGGTIYQKAAEKNLGLSYHPFRDFYRKYREKIE